MSFVDKLTKKKNFQVLKTWANEFGKVNSSIRVSCNNLKRKISLTQKECLWGPV